MNLGRIRTGVLDVAGLGWLVYSAWNVHPTAGAAAAGVACLLLARRGDPDAAAPTSTGGP